MNGFDWSAIGIDPSQVALFRGLSREDLDALSPVFRRRELAADALLYRQGEIADCAWVICRGRVGVSLDSAMTRAQMTTFLPHDVLGEMHLLRASRQTTSAATTEPSVLVEISRASFQALLVDWEPAAYRLARQLARLACMRLRSLDQLLAEQPVTRRPAARALGGSVPPLPTVFDEGHFPEGECPETIPGSRTERRAVSSLWEREK